MILVIDTTKREMIKIGLAEKAKPQWFEIETADQSNDILPAIEGVLKNNKLTLKDIKTIVVNQGPGSFTGVRVGIAVANALAWSLDIPVQGFRDGKLDSAIAKTKDNFFPKIVLPYYK